MKNSLVLIISSILLFASCKKPDTACNATILKQAIAANDIALMRTEINKLCSTIAVVPTSNDPDGLRNSLDALVAKLNQSCGVESSILCYFCIKTLPEQAEIKLTSASVTRIVDISYSTDKRLVFVSMHD